MTQPTVTLESLRLAINAYAAAPTPWQKRDAMRRIVETSAGFAEKVRRMSQWLSREDQWLMDQEAEQFLKSLEATSEYATRQERWCSRVVEYERAHDVLQQSLSLIAGKE
jgi:hypothetical protein